MTPAERAALNRAAYRIIAYPVTEADDELPGLRWTKAASDTKARHWDQAAPAVHDGVCIYAEEAAMRRAVERQARWATVTVRDFAAARKLVAAELAALREGGEGKRDGS